MKKLPKNLDFFRVVPIYNLDDDVISFLKMAHSFLMSVGAHFSKNFMKKRKSYSKRTYVRTVKKTTVTTQHFDSPFHTTRTRQL